nr:MAG: hypothetical protein [Lake Baikal virophage 4]
MEQGLKRQIIRQRTFKEDAQFQVRILLNENTKLALAGVLKEEHVWNIVLKLGLWKEGIKSSSVGVLSTIADYTNKAGKTFKAHFTENGYFLEKCKHDNDKPITYEGNFEITRERFRFELNPHAQLLQHLFVGRVAEVDQLIHSNYASSSSESDDDEAPLSAVAKKITIRLKIKDSQGAS